VVIESGDGHNDHQELDEDLPLHLPNYQLMRIPGESLLAESFELGLRLYHMPHQFDHAPVGT
jgi:hypothetical protein